MSDKRSEIQQAADNAIELISEQPDFIKGTLQEPRIFVDPVEGVLNIMTGCFAYATSMGLMISFQRREIPYSQGHEMLLDTREKIDKFVQAYTN